MGRTKSTASSWQNWSTMSLKTLQNQFCPWCRFGANVINVRHQTKFVITWDTYISDGCHSRYGMVSDKVLKAICVSTKFYNVQNSRVGWGQCEPPVIGSKSKKYISYFYIKSAISKQQIIKSNQPYYMTWLLSHVEDFLAELHSSSYVCYNRINLMCADKAKC